MIRLSACECSDTNCPVHPGKHCGYKQTQTKVLYRIDMEDRTGTAFCVRCAIDAFDSGLFTDEKVQP